MATINQKFLDTLHQISQEWGLKAVTRLSENAKRKKLKNTGQLIQSIDEYTRSELAAMLTVISIQFQEYGRFHDMKRNYYEGTANIDNILEWVKQKGISSFGADPRPNKKKPKTITRRQNEIAWGIGRNRNQKRKKKAWFQSSFFGMLNALQEELLLGIADRTVEEIKESITSRLGRGGTTGKFF